MLSVGRVAPSAEGARAGDPSDLALNWREEAERLRALEAHGQAAAFEHAASELEAAMNTWSSELLTVREAAFESGYSEEHLRRLVRQGDLPAERNGGPRSHVRIRRADLPIKRRGDGRESREDLAYNPDEDARDIAQLMEAM